MRRTARFGILLLAVVAIMATGCATTRESRQEQRSEGERRLAEGNMHLTNGNLEMAMFELTKAEKLIGDSAEVHFAIGTVYILRNEPALAVQKFKRALKLDPHHADAYNNLGYAHMLLGNFDEAIEASQKAIDEVAYETPERAFTIIGWSQYKKGNTPEAIDYLKRALMIRANQPETENHLATIYIEEGRLDKAKELLVPLVARVPRYAKARLNLGIVYYKEKNRRAAAGEFRAVIENAPANSEEARLARGYLDLVE